jgi:serine/threonine-protein kinase
MSVELNMRARARLGSTLRGKYTLERVLGAGGMAVVYKAVHRNRAEFAVKMLLPELSHDDEVRTRFLREGYAANSVKHPGVVAIVDDDVADDGAAFIVMELLDGVSVEDLAQKHGGRVPPKIASSIGCQVLEVIAAAHDKGILHRDLKPANLFLMKNGQVKVLDFGIARVRDLASKGAHATQTGTSFGTPAFMSPEQARGKTKEIDERSDVWAIGATLFALLTGSCVHDGESSNEIMVKAATEPARHVGPLVPGIPPLVASVIDRALAFVPAQRWESASAMRAALESAHTECFGAPPSQAELAAFLTQTPATPVSKPMVETRRALAAVGATTAIPVATEGPKRTRNRGVLVAAISGGTMLLVGLAAIGIYARNANGTTTTGATATGIVTSVITTVTETASAPPPPTVVTLPTQTATIPTVTIATTATHKSTVVVALPKASASAAKPGCNPPYTLDKNGERHYKPECY